MAVLKHMVLLIGNNLILVDNLSMTITIELQLVIRLIMKFQILL